jgi:hypothetical protein
MTSPQLRRPPPRSRGRSTLTQVFGGNAQTAVIRSNGSNPRPRRHFETRSRRDGRPRADHFYLARAVKTGSGRPFMPTSMAKMPPVIGASAKPASSISTQQPAKSASVRRPTGVGVAAQPSSGPQDASALRYVSVKTMRPSGRAQGPSGWPMPSARTLVDLFIVETGELC